MAIGFARFEFQLVLMWRMLDLAPGRVEDALKELGASRAQMRAAHRRWVSMPYSKTAPKGLARYRMVLGPPDDSGPREFGDLDCTYSLWTLPLWPDLRFEVLTAPDGSAWHHWLVRAEGSPVPELGLHDLTPWSCVVSDMGQRFENARHVEGDAPGHWGVAFSVEGRDYLARFVHGLLQLVQEAPR
ncbi:hypothetical protein ACGFNU_08380 [Spirillospora sp. NPDC048911]|uniref:hypothetical protein n=1 Tax=Spirillospora sp. NPDC048911 TaxID=3364527 RepID=UPI00372493EE